MTKKFIDFDQFYAILQQIGAKAWRREWGDASFVIPALSLQVSKAKAIAARVR